MTILMAITGYLLILLGGLWFLSRLMNLPRMLIIFTDNKELGGTLFAIRMAVTAELVMGYGPAFLLMYLGSRLI